MKKKKQKYFEPGLLSMGYEYEQEEEHPDDCECLECGEEDIEESKSLQDELLEIIKRREYYVNRSGNEDRVMLTDKAPKHLIDLSGDGIAWLVKDYLPELKVRFDNSEELHDVEPEWILFFDIN